MPVFPTLHFNAASLPRTNADDCADARAEAASDPLASRRYGKQFGPKGVQADAEYAAFLEMKEVRNRLRAASAK